LIREFRRRFPFLIFSSVLRAISKSGISADQNVMIEQKRFAEQLLHPMKGFFLFEGKVLLRSIT